MVSCTALETCVTQVRNVHQKFASKESTGVMCAWAEPAFVLAMASPLYNTLKARTHNNDHMRAVISKGCKPARRRD